VDARMGRYDEAEQMLNQASQIATQKAAFLALQAYLTLAQAEISLANRSFDDAEAKGTKALESVGAQDKTVEIEARRIICISQTQTGRAAAAVATCLKASDTANTLGDPLLLAESQLALAEAALAAGDAKRALDIALKAQIFFASNNLTERNWRAWLMAGLASRKLSDQANADVYFKNAADSFSALEQKWGAEIFKAYQNRPDVQIYRRQLPRS